MHSLHLALSSLPPSLDETYSRILERIEQDEKPHVRRILQWLCFSKRPLRLEEILCIYNIGDNVQPPFNPRNDLFKPEDIFDICLGLLSLVEVEAMGDHEWRFFDYDTTLHIVQLAHFSVKEYLLSARALAWSLDEQLSHVSILKASSAYYLHFITLDGIDILSMKDLVMKYSLAEYAASYTSKHLNDLVPREHPDLLPSLSLLLDPCAFPCLFANKIGVLFLDPDPDVYHLKEGLRNLASRRNKALNLILAIQLGLCQTTKLLFSRRVHANLNVPIKDKFSYYDPLTEATNAGHIDVVRLLLDAGADPRVDCLRVAAAAGHKEIVQLFLDAGIGTEDGDLTGWTPRTALEAAAESGHLEIVQILLNARARTCHALQVASFKGHPEIVRVLIAAGADVNHHVWEFGSAIQAAAFGWGGEAVVSILLAARADVDSNEGGFGTALMSASRRGDRALVRLLIQANADMNLERGPNGTALQEASIYGDECIVRMLIDAGADVNAGGGYFGSALRAASYRGHKDVVRVLIEAGADVNSKGGPYFTTLRAASANGHYEVVQILEDAGATWY
jgi:ankyrin repeat protein